MTDAVLDRPERMLNLPFHNVALPVIAKTQTLTISPALLDEDLQWLEHLSLHALQDMWRTTYGQRAPRRLGAEFLRRALAYRLQEIALGSLSRRAQLRLKAWRQRPHEDGGSTKSWPVPSMMKPGTRFVREWQGETHEVQAIENETYIYKSKIFRSLTVIATEITGTHQSGPRFFGLRRQDSKALGSEQRHV